MYLLFAAQLRDKKLIPDSPIKHLLDDRMTLARALPAVERRRPIHGGSAIASLQ
jgi:hypothetical protein